MKEIIIDSIGDFINTLNQINGDIEFNVETESENISLCSGGMLKYINFDKDNKENICIIYGKSNLDIKVNDIQCISDQSTYYTIETDNSCFKKIKFRILESKTKYIFNI